MAAKKSSDSVKTRDSIESVMQETRVFDPPEAFESERITSVRSFRRIANKAAKDPEAWFASLAAELEWMREPTTTLRWREPKGKAPRAEWFLGGQLNMSTNCLDRHCRTWRRTKAAIIWEGEDGSVITLTYQQLLAEVCKAANVLRDLGVKRGETVGIYMGMVPEAAIAMLACARIGAVHNVVFGGFSAEALAERMNDAAATLLITQDGAWRRGQVVDLKAAADAAAKKAPSIKNMLVVRRAGNAATMRRGRDHWWHDLVDNAPATARPERLRSEHPLYVLYTSGSTGKPKGILHTTAGTMLWAQWTTQNVFDLRDDDIYWCTADIGWVTGHSYVVYGPLLAGGTTLMYEGAPNFPAPNRFWDVIERHRVSIFYTAPTAIRAFMRWGDEHPKGHDLGSLRLLGSVGEPINPEAWMWYRSIIGGNRYLPRHEQSGADHGKLHITRFNHRPGRRA